MKAKISTLYAGILLMLIAPQAFSQVVTLPVDFENTDEGYYNFFNFDGGTASIVENPDMSGINGSAMVGKIVRNGGQVWAGSYLTLDTALDFSEIDYLTMKVFSPRADMEVLLKIETDKQVGKESRTKTTVANEWETLTFQYDAGDVGFTRLVFMFDIGAVGDGTDNSTFYFDDVYQGDFVDTTTFRS